jgi:double-stranded uracil-DNA glycosylase
MLLGHGAEVPEAPVQHCFAPVVQRDTQLLILGSLPGAMSLAAQRYYANPRNQFWRLMERVLGEPLVELPYEERLETLLARGVGLWDTVQAARRPGSLDAAIRLEAASDVAGLAASLPRLRAIAFNGGTSARIGRRQFGSAPSPDLIDLPSSSPAFTLAFEEKAKAWSHLRSYLRR